MVNSTTTVAIFLLAIAAVQCFRVASDSQQASASCKGRCGHPYDSSQPCQCNDACVNHKDCCEDWAEWCHQDVISNQDLADISSLLHRLDLNSVSGISLNLQAKIKEGDEDDLAPLALFASVPTNFSQGPTISTMLALFNNYEAAVETPELVTPAESRENDAFIDAMFATDVVKQAHQFLASKNKMSKDINVFKEYFKTIWFGMYSRAKNNNCGSCGFEHDFVGELKNGITGLHSWLRYYDQERSGNMNYLGYINRVQLSASSTLLEMPLNWLGLYKPISSIAIGCSPELEMALATICFVARPDSLCPVRSSTGQAYHYQTYTLTYKSTVYVGSAYSTL